MKPFPATLEPAGPRIGAAFRRSTVTSSKRNLAWSRRLTTWLAACKQVIHAAAEVRHYADGDDSPADQCPGTENVIAFAKAANAKLFHISTASVSGEYLVDHPDRCAVFSEDDFDIGQN